MLLGKTLKTTQKVPLFIRQVYTECDLQQASIWQEYEYSDTHHAKKTKINSDRCASLTYSVLSAHTRSIKLLQLHLITLVCVITMVKTE